MSVRLPPDLASEIEGEAQRYATSPSEIARHVLRLGLERFRTRGGILPVGT